MLPYLPEPQAAALLGLTPEELRARGPGAGIAPVALMGAILYRLADIEEAAELLLARSEAADYRRHRDECLEALREIYRDFGEDSRIAEACRPLLDAYS